jgi:hypothetical protein
MGHAPWGIMAALSCLLPADATGQARRKVSYEVEFSVLGAQLDKNCAALGTDKLVGTITGMEPATDDEPNVYVGMLTRTTNITTCGERMIAGVGKVCNINISGSGTVDVMLTIEADERGAWLKYLEDRTEWARLLPPRLLGPSQSNVTGTCEGGEMGEIQSAYDGGSTAGSPNGQPIEITSFPPATFPVTYQPRPPESMWTLKVLRRLP